MILLGSQHIKFHDASSWRPPGACDSGDVNHETSQIPCPHFADFLVECQATSARRAWILSIRPQQQKRIPSLLDSIPGTPRDIEHADSKPSAINRNEIIMRSRCQPYDRGINAIRESLHITATWDANKGFVKQ